MVPQSSVLAVKSPRKDQILGYFEDRADKFSWELD